MRCARCGNRYEGVTEPTGTKRPGGSKRATRTAYACGAYIRGGRAVCARGTVSQEAMEAPVVEAMLRCYERYASAEGGAMIEAAVRGATGGEQERLCEEGEALRRRLAEIDSITRNLLDTLSTADRQAVERRVVELESERAAIEERLGSIDRVRRTAKEARAIASRVRGFVERLPRVMASAPPSRPADRHAALRSCIVAADYDHAAGRTRVEFRAVPTAAAADGQGPTETVEVPIP